MFSENQANQFPGLYEVASEVKPKDFNGFNYACFPGSLKSKFPRKSSSFAMCDKVKVALLIIDAQKDFCDPDGALYVSGAQQDMQRLFKFGCDNLGKITTIIRSADKHYEGSIFFAERHLKPDGTNPSLFFPPVTADDYLFNRWHSNPLFGNEHELDRHTIHYCMEAAKAGQSLTIWPHHCMIGTKGMEFVDKMIVLEKIHSYYRSANNLTFYKGEELNTEYYSVFGPVVKRGYDGNPLARKPGVTVSELDAFDIIIVAGEALSHCVGQTLRDLIEAGLGEKIYLVRDCTSSVAGFEYQGESLLKLLAYAGGHVVQSTTPFLKWPGVNAIFEGRR